ncbi:MAG TPA: hypothetical protein VKY57_02530 [Chitinispirillaceae bacterium]|nr:hypothetical protein [Chitinispirillaceae bacterium]
MYYTKWRRLNYYEPTKTALPQKGFYGCEGHSYLVTTTRQPRTLFTNIHKADCVKKSYDLGTIMFRIRPDIYY